MGMDPLDHTEDFEVSIVLKGPVKKKEFRLFRKQLEKFIDACEAIQDSAGNKLKVREHRTGVRRNL